MATLIDVLFVCIVVAAFAFGLRAGIAMLIAVRPMTDRLFELGSFDVGGRVLTFGVLLNVVVLAAAAVSFAQIQRDTPAKLRSAWLPFLLVCAVGVLYSPLPVDAARRVWIYLCYYFMFGLSFVVIKTERDVVFFLKVVIASSVVPVLYALFQAVSGLDLYDLSARRALAGAAVATAMDSDSGSRIQSTFDHPNMLAFYLVAVVGVMVFLLTNERFRISARLRILLYLYFVPLLAALVMSKTRSAWIGCVVLLIVYGVGRDRRVLAALLVAAPIVFMIPAVNDRIMALMSQNAYIGGAAVSLNSYAWRKLLWDSALTYFWERPIFGYGLHSFPFYSAEFFSPVGSTFAHNDYLQVLFETGVVGLIAFLWIFWRCYAWLIPRWRFDKTGVVVVVGILTAHLVCSFSDNLLEYLPYQWEFWLPFGVMCWHIENCRVRTVSLASRGSFAGWSSAQGTKSPAT